MFSRVIFFALLFFALPSFAQVGHLRPRELNYVPDSFTNWESFKADVDKQERIEHVKGMSYIITGAVVAVGGGIFKAQSSDSLTRLTLSLFQSVGIGGIGYGAALYNLSGRDQLIRDMIEDQPNLTPAQRDGLISSYRSLNKENERKRRLIMAITYGLVSAFNVVNATGATEETNRSIYWAVAGVNAALGLAYTF